MKRESTRLDPARISAALLERRATVGAPLVVMATTESTNADARRAVGEDAPHGAVFVADAQRAGRGRGGNRWHSPPGSNIYLSLVLRMRCGAEVVPPFALALGVAVARVADEALGRARARIKWPNDVYVDDKKIAGILVEALTRDGAPPVLVAGVGLNVLAQDFPPELAHTATSLECAGPSVLSREVITAALIDGIGRAATRFERNGLAPFLTELRARDFLVGRSIAVDDEVGVARGIDSDGRLRLERSDGTTMRMISGHVALSSPS